MPLELTATFPGGQGCPCLDGVSLILTFDAVDGVWRGTATVCDSELLTVDFACNGTACDDAELTVELENHGIAPTVGPDGGCSCAPRSWDFTGIDFPVQGAECDGNCRVVVTD